MSNPHEPRDVFVAQLEERLRADLDRQRLAPTAPRWLPRTTRGLVFATAAVVLLSMAIGGGVVSAAYEAQQSAGRDALLTMLQQRADLARTQLTLARHRMDEAMRRASVGIDDASARDDARRKVAEAEVEVKIIELEMAEVRATGREPVRSVSAPLVAGRDFVTERWQIEASVPTAVLDLAKAEADRMKTRFEVGLANTRDVQAAGARLIEMESALQLVQRKIAIRQEFLRRAITAAVADLRVMEAETEQRHQSLARRIAFSQRQLQDLRTMVEIGTLSPIDLAEAQLRLQELQVQLSKADYDLALIRKQLGK